MNSMGKEIKKEKFKVSGSGFAYTIPLFFPNGDFWTRLEVSEELYKKYTEAYINHKKN